MAKYYSTPEAVIRFTGVRAKDLSLADDLELHALITEWLVGIKDIIDHSRNRDYHSEKVVPPGIHQIAMRVAANAVAVAVLRRETPIVKRDDFSVWVSDDKIFSDNILRDLSTFPPKPRFRMGVV